MPGILPMKVIKVGTTSQSRIAQACDRCRSKKIRCDGVTPCCSQCRNVGFECKTSDKLSRRAFPRGYTESLEERVRSLEGEARELKDLLDGKDEKIDLLSRVQSFSPRKLSNSPPATDLLNSANQEDRDDKLKVHQPSTLQKCEHKSDPFFIGNSSTRVFIDTIWSKVQNSGDDVSNFDTSALSGRCDLGKPAKRADFSKNVSRLVSDQLVNIFFQEWAPLLPVLHRPSFLDIYADYVNDTCAINEAASIAQLNLVFGIAAIANESSIELLSYFEAQWQGAVGAIVTENKLVTLQCLVLAQLYCMIRGDSNKLVYYSAVAANMARRLGLHQNQKRFSQGVLVQEMRKKVFWSLYTLDIFGAVSLGLPKLLKDEDIETEEPADVDDENINEQGFRSAHPGESTKLSSALALFRLARILSKVQTELYPAAQTCELSRYKIGQLSVELGEWRNDLAPHLRLEFAKDKPSSSIISSRCPLLGLFYYYVRIYVHRPVLQADISTHANSSILAVAESAKHIIQILQLLQERNLSYTACINKSELLFTCAFGLIYQLSELSPDSKLRKDSEQCITACVDLLERSGVPAVISFRKIAQIFTPQPEFVKPARHGTSSGGVSPKSSQELNKSNKSHIHAIATRFSLPSIRNNKTRTSSTKSDQLHIKSDQGKIQIRLSSVSSEPAIKHRGSKKPSLSLGSIPKWTPNLDYLPLGTPTSIASSMDTKTSITRDMTDWDGLLNSLDPIGLSGCNNGTHFATNGTTAGTSGGDISPPFAVRHSSDASFSTPPLPLDWSGIEWNNPDGSGWASLFDNMTPQDQTHHNPPNNNQNSSSTGDSGSSGGGGTATKSVLSFSGDNTSGEDRSSCDLGSESKAYSLTKTPTAAAAAKDDYYSLRDAASPTPAEA